jgi:hypothetical protein
VLSILALLAAPAPAHELRGPEGAPTGAVVDARSLLRPEPLRAALPLGTPAADLAAVAASALAYLEAMDGQDPAVGPGLLAELGLPPDRLRRTLAQVVAVAEEDRLSPAPRLEDPAWVAAHFHSLRWFPDSGPQDGRVRVTRYLVTRLPGRDQPEPPYTVPLYADPGEEARTRYTRAEIVAGAWAGGGATPLVYLREEGLYDAMMQGTVEVEVPGRPPRLFNVHTHNGVPYDRTQRDPRLQRRYWYFREVQEVRGWGKADRYVALRPGAAVAGDIYNLGLGALLAVDAPGSRRLVVLADTGGAFQPNLHQLDWLAGTYADHGAMYRAMAWLPDRAEVRMLLWREPWEP